MNLELLLSKKEIKSLRKENKDLKNQLHSQPGFIIIVYYYKHVVLL